MTKKKQKKYIEHTYKLKKSEFQAFVSKGGQEEKMELINIIKYI